MSEGEWCVDTGGTSASGECVRPLALVTSAAADGNAGTGDTGDGEASGDATGDGPRLEEAGEGGVDEADEDADDDADAGSDFAARMTGAPSVPGSAAASHNEKRRSADADADDEVLRDKNGGRTLLPLPLPLPLSPPVASAAAPVISKRLLSARLVDTADADEESGGPMRTGKAGDRRKCAVAASPSPKPRADMELGVPSFASEALEKDKVADEDEEEEEGDDATRRRACSGDDTTTAPSDASSSSCCFKWCAAVAAAATAAAAAAAAGSAECADSDGRRRFETTGEPGTASPSGDDAEAEVAAAASDA